MSKKIIFKKFILGIFVFLFILPFFVKSASAFETPNPTYQFQFEEAISSQEMNLQSFVNETIKAIMGSFMHVIIGTINPTTNEQSQNLNINNLPKDGLISAVFLITSNIYSYPPVSGINYFAKIGRDLKIIKPTYAQQENVTGFNVLEPVQQIWKTFRNFSYLLFVLVLIGMGFAIMFRLKISPQAVVTIQSALPKIVIALILITFSYAIVGLLFDVIVFLNRLVAGIFLNLLNDPNLSWPDFRDGLMSFVRALTPNVFERDVVMGPPQEMFQFAVVGFFIFQAFVFLLFPVVGLIVNFIIAVVVFIALIRCLWTIIKAIAMIIVNLIFAPFRILAGVFPGSTAITDWFKDLIANGLVLPLMLIFFGLSSYLIFAGAGLSTSGDWWKGIFAGRPFFPSESFVPLTVRAILPFCGLALLLMAPKVSEIIQSAITKKPFAFGSAIGEAMGPGTYPFRQFRTGAEKRMQENFGEVSSKISPAAALKYIGTRGAAKKPGGGGETPSVQAEESEGPSV